MPKKLSQAQAQENEIVEHFYHTTFLEEIYTQKWAYKSKKLFHCSADILTSDTSPYILLRSYATIIAVFDTQSGELFDFLRLVYGYTNTSTQHYHKFRKLIEKDYLIYAEYRYLK